MGEIYMRLRNIPGAREKIQESVWVIQNPEEYRDEWQQPFKNDHPVHIEIGTGKGRFITQLASEHPEINYVGIEKFSSVLIRALEKQDELELTNLLFIRGDAENVTDYFGKGEVGKIYLNFSDPWPKKRYAKRRLPSRQFLQRYDQILSDGGIIEFKTDNQALFDWSVEEVPYGGFAIQQITYDLHNDPVMNIGNIMTEYEERFSSKGNTICKYILARPDGVTQEEKEKVKKAIDEHIENLNRSLTEE